MTEKEYQRILVSINCAEKKRRGAVQEEYRRNYLHRRHTEEIERQLNGVMEEYVEPVVQHQLKERTREEPRATHQDDHKVEGTINSNQSPLICKKTQCPFCIGEESMTYAERTFSYCHPSMMEPIAIFERSQLTRRFLVVIQYANKILDNTMHFKNHVKKVHGISLRA